LKPQEVWTDLIEKKASSTADLDLEGRAIPAGKVVRIETYYVIDATHADKTMKLGYVKAEKTITLKREPTATSAYHVFLEEPLILVEGEKLKATVESATSGDECTLVAKGVFI